MAGVQLRYETGLTGERYVTAGAWRRARLERCPNHPRGGCSLARHGTYERKTPPGTRVARWYCPESHTTFSLLPDCLAARLPGTLDALEAVVVAAEGARSLEAAANELRRDAVELPGAMRWVRRRVRLVHNVLARVIGPIPDRLAGCAAIADLGGKHRTEAVPPKSHRFAADVDPALEQQIFDLPQRQRVANIHHHSEANDLR